MCVIIYSIFVLYMITSEQMSEFQWWHPVDKYWQKYQQTSSRRDLNSCLEYLYRWCKNFCYRRYSYVTKFAYSFEDVLHWAIIKLLQYIRQGRVENGRHLVNLFCCCCKNACTYISYRQKRLVSLNAALNGDSTITLEEFIASKLKYPTLEQSETIQKINAILDGFCDFDRRIIEWIWFEGYTVREIAIDLNTSSVSVQKILNIAKIRVMRGLLNAG